MARESAEERKPMHAKCGPCGHIWPIAYLPMDADKVARIMKGARCPMCASTSREHFVAETARKAFQGGSSGADDTYYLTSIADFHTIPLGKVQHCVEDFLLWLLMVRFTDQQEGLKVATRSKAVFGWVDDGRHDANIRVRLQPEVTGSSVRVERGDAQS
jgi:hypothetical protein